MPDNCGNCEWFEMLLNSKIMGKCTWWEDNPHPIERHNQYLRSKIVSPKWTGCPCHEPKEKESK